MYHYYVASLIYGAFISSINYCCCCRFLPLGGGGSYCNGSLWILVMPLGAWLHKRSLSQLCLEMYLYPRHLWSGVKSIWGAAGKLPLNFWLLEPLGGLDPLIGSSIVLGGIIFFLPKWQTLNYSQWVPPGGMGFPFTIRTRWPFNWLATL